MDFIDREQAMNIFSVDLAEKDRRVSYQGFCIDAAMAIGSLPSAEKTGRWILNDNGTFSCSLCQSWIPNEQHHYARYCLYCGARMVSDEDKH